MARQQRKEKIGRLGAASFWGVIISSSYCRVNMKDTIHDYNIQIQFTRKSLKGLENLLSELKLLKFLQLSELSGFKTLCSIIE